LYGLRIWVFDPYGGDAVDGFVRSWPIDKWEGGGLPSDGGVPSLLPGGEEGGVEHEWPASAIFCSWSIVISIYELPIFLKH